ncbi:putative ABC transport system ATP-binding protein [Propionibacterium cyclohexanicum]|uniref:Putative ABC transport system ATP-binding protein n=1 Tax=Propionibacterium cyclohexanicum TaxID=64702 RepID=A0A1H9QGW4_9ACTN|nr:ABC transporter ATP-binding protein [Propionibacterium cyclohexanicum]SER59704.1 putative ABC transport system ATP-binding protein [Propionibacterium cyclohexanicum]
MYTLTNVTKTYSGRHPVTALDHVNLTIPDGQLVAIEGPTGGGKSTLLQMLGALDVPSSGDVELGDVQLARAGERQLTKVRAERIGIVFQNFNLIATLSAQENVETALVPLHVSAAERRERAMKALESVNMADRADHLPSELSGGQQQRVAIARALVKKPRVLLADEPTGNLDVGTRDEILELLLERWRADSLTVVMVTHDPRVAEGAQRRLRIEHGTLHETMAAG